MADGIFTFSPRFNEFLPLYQNVVRLWIGDGEATGQAGMLYVQYEDGSTAELGSVTIYSYATQAGYEGSPQEWAQVIWSIADMVKGSTIEMSYMVSSDGTEHPDPEDEWSPTPVFEKGKFTWVKMDMKWIDRTTSTLYFATYQGQDGQVESVNGETGHIVIHGANLPISADSEQTIKEYIDEVIVPETATDEEIDALFSMVFFSGAAFIHGRQFEAGDSISYEIEPITANAPMPQENITTIYPLGGTSARFRFGYVMFKQSDIPVGQTSKTFEYRVFEKSHTLDGVPSNPEVYYTSITLIDNGDGTVKIDKGENFNALYFNYNYSAMGRVVFEGGIQLNGRSMAAREFMVQIKEGNEVVADNISTLEPAASGVLSPISFPAINYTLADIGTHTYTVRETSQSGDGVTISDAVYTVTVRVLDRIRDGHLEIETDDTEKNLNFVNTYTASGTATFIGTETLVHRVFRDGDTLSISMTGNGRLPSPAVTPVTLVNGNATANFQWETVTYTLSDMRNSGGGYDDSKTFTYVATEIMNIPGVTTDGKIHNVLVRVTDNKKGTLLTDIVYNDGEKFEFTGTYNATGTITFMGEKRLENRRFVAADSMDVSISSSDGKLPYIPSKSVNLLVGQHVAPFEFLQVEYQLSDINYEESKTFHYFIREDTDIRGASDDSLTHSVDVLVRDNHDGTLTVTPTYSDGAKTIFTAIYDATGFLAIRGVKNIVNRGFKSGDVMSVTATSASGKLPSPSSISVPLVVDANTASFSFAQIAYKITDLIEGHGVFDYVLTETITMPGTTPVSTTDTVSVDVSDNCDGTLTVVPTYTQGDRAVLTNVYAASADLSFKTRCVFTNGNMNTNSFDIRVTQVTGNNSTTQATENVVLQAPVTMTANNGNIQDLDFSNIVHFVKNSNTDHTQATYWFMIEEVLPQIDAQGIYNNVHYDSHKKWVNVNVSDNFNGTLQITKNPAADVSTGLDDTFTNEQLANLTIHKIWTGDWERLTTDEKNPFIFTVTGPSSYSVSFTYGDMVNNDYVLTKLHKGEYVVTESNTTVENFIVTTTYSVNGVATNRVDLPTGGATVNVSDNVNRLEGTLNIDKVWTGDHDKLTAQQKNRVTFTVTGPKQKSTDASEYRQVFTYAEMVNNRKTFEHLTLGTYYVVESNFEVEYFDASVSYSVDGINVNSVYIEDADNKVVTITDNYVQHVGNVKVSKKFIGIDPLDKPVNFSITNSYNASVFTYDNADNKNSVNGVDAPYEWTIHNVPVTTHITFEEHEAGINDYDLEATAEPIDYTSAGVIRNETVEVKIFDNYILHRGSVEVSKLFVGIDPNNKPADFCIKNDYDDSVFTYYNAYNRDTVNGVDNPYRWIIRNVPVHTRITFTEYDAGITDYDVTSSAVPADYRSAEVTKNGTAYVDITNTYDLHKGTVKVTKLFSGITEALKPANFRIRNSYNNTVFTYDNADNKTQVNGVDYPYEWTITDVPVHTTVLFTEENADVTDYDVALTSIPANRTCAPVTKGGTSTVALLNTYTYHTGSVVLKKQFSGIESAQKPANFYISCDYNQIHYDYTNADNAASCNGISEPYQWTIANVPVHTAITFTEHDAGITDYDLVTSCDCVDRTCDPVVHNEQSIITFTNAYTLHRGSVTVTKLFENINPEQIPASFNIKNSYDASLTFTPLNADNREQADGVHRAFEWRIDNIPVHERVTFTEYNTAITNYDLITTSVPAGKISDAVEKNQNKTVALTNTYTLHTGTVKVRKVFSGIPQGSEPINYRIENSYNADVFTCANGTYTSGGYEWTITNVPVTTSPIQFTEYNTELTNYEVVNVSNPADGICPSVAKDTTSNVVFTGTYTRDTGSIVVTKQFSGISTSDIPESTFSITNDQTSDTLTIPQASNYGTVDGITDPFEWTISGIPTGTEVEFTETGYDVSGYIQSGNTTLTSDPVVKTNPVQVDFVNAYEGE